MKTSRSRYRLSQRFSYVIIGGVTLILLIICSTVILYSIAKINDEYERRIHTVKNLARVSLKPALWNFQNDTVVELLDTIFSNDGVVYINITDGSDSIGTRSAPGYGNYDLTFFKSSPNFSIIIEEINYENRRIGTIQLAMQKNKFTSELISKILGLTLFMAAISFIAITLTSIAITRRFIFRPLLKLEKSAISIAEGNLETEINTN